METGVQDSLDWHEWWQLSVNLLSVAAIREAAAVQPLLSKTHVSLNRKFASEQTVIAIALATR